MNKVLLLLSLAALLEQPACAERGTEASRKTVSQVTFPAVFTGWTWIGMWDTEAGSWMEGRNENAPSQFSLSGIVSGRWYWIGVWDYAAGVWAFGDWHFKMRVQAVPAGMVRIPGGTNAGTNPLASGESYSAGYPETYSLTVDAFYMDRYEVTKTLWDEVYTWAVGNGYAFTNSGSGKALDHPVHTVNWFDCVKWCNARSQKEGRTPVYYTDAGFTEIYRTGHVPDPHVLASANGYRLPTDAEWHYAGRGGPASRRFTWSDSDAIDHGRANYFSFWSDGAPYYSYDLASNSGHHPGYNTGGVPYTSPAGFFAANAFGLYDMTGNLAEWCFDWHPGDDGSYRVHRGGGWASDAFGCRVGFRDRSAPDQANYYIGLRTVLSGQ